MKDINLEEMVNAICKHIPHGYIVGLEMENGSAVVYLLTEPYGDYVDLPDAADKTIIEQLNDALLAANGWGRA